MDVYKDYTYIYWDNNTKVIHKPYTRKVKEFTDFRFFNIRFKR